jgi:hypothetical protein
MVEFGGNAMHVVQGGLDLDLWGYSIAFGAGSLPIQQIINLVKRSFDYCGGKKEAS